jgi:glycosyltransferase involved in cell wall biosynthesis
MTRRTPFISVVIRSKDEADRLRLTLASLECQAADCEIVVVDDGSSDHTGEIIAGMGRTLPIVGLRHDRARGRSAASNAGARAARGHVLLFHDGDTLFGPDSLAVHTALHAGSPDIVVRGETMHLRGTRLLRDPDSGAPWLEHADAVSRRPAAEIDRMRVTMDQVRQDFASIDSRAEHGIYPGTGPRRLFELEMEALVNAPDCGVLWSAACGSNLSVRRTEFIEAGGFNDTIDINEHRELALRLVRRGNRLVPGTSARSYHMTHRSGWRDPLHDTAWENAFLRAHPIPAVALLSVFWASLSPASTIPQSHRIGSLPELERAATGQTGLDYDMARRAIGARVLGADFWRSGAA